MIYICIPAYNEERSAGILLWRIREVMSEFGRDYQVLLLDDASSDRTPEVIAPYTQILPLEIMRNQSRQGHGASLEKLLSEAIARCSYPRRDVIVTLQADFTEEPEAIPTMVKRIEGGADLVVTAHPGNGLSRTRTASWIRRGLPLLERRFNLPSAVSDPTSGLRAYRVSVVKRALAGNNGKKLLQRDGWAASLELLAAAAPHARRIEETPPQTHYDRRSRKSRMSLWRATRDFVGMLRQR